MKFLALLALASLAFANEEKCPEHEVWKQCALKCQPNCLTRDMILPCVKSCHAGCICEHGYTRQGWDHTGGKGKCVESGMCDSLIRAARTGHSN